MRNYKILIILTALLQTLSSAANQRERILLVEAARDTNLVALCYQEFQRDLAAQLNYSMQTQQTFIEHVTLSPDFIAMLAIGEGVIPDDDAGRLTQSMVKTIVWYKLKRDGETSILVGGCCDVAADSIRPRFPIRSVASRTRTITDDSVASLLQEDVVNIVGAGLDKRIRVFVIEFGYRGKIDGLKYLGLSVADRIRTRLSASRGITVISLLQESDTSYRKAGSRKRYTLPDLTQREAAKYAVTGTFSEIRGGIGFEAQEVDLETGQTIVSFSDYLDSLSGRKFFEMADRLGDLLRTGIEVRQNITEEPGRRRIAVVGLPPKPGSNFNSELTERVVSSLESLLRLHSTSPVSRLVVVSPDAQSLKRYREAEYDRCVISNEQNAQLLWTVRLERPLQDLGLTFELSSVFDAGDSTHRVHYSFSSIRELDDLLVERARTFLLHHEVCKQVDSTTMEHMRYVQVEKELYGIRVRYGFIGLTRQSKDLFLNNDLRLFLEGALLYFLPGAWQLEFAFCYDFGKLSETSPSRIYGGYIHGGGRYNVGEVLIPDSRGYVGTAFCFFGVARKVMGVKRADHTWGNTVSLGIEVPAWRTFFFDVNVQYFFAWGAVDGIDGDFSATHAAPRSLAVGLGIGFRF